MQNYRTPIKNNSPIAPWGQILLPVICYLAALWLLRTGLVRFFGLAGNTASLIAAACLFVPVFLLYLLKWKNECAPRSNTASFTGKEFLLWGLAVLAMAALSICCGGAPEDIDHSLPVFAVTCLLAPVSEEILFRGQFLGRGKSALPIPALLLTGALLFAAAHGTGRALLATFPAGILLGMLYLREERLTGIVIVHCSANALIFAAPYILG